MSTTPIGILIMLIGFYGFFRSPKLLLGLTVFFIPFSATAVINIGAKGAGSAIQPFMFLGLLNYVLIVLKSIKNKFQYKPLRREAKAFRYLICFLFVCLLSLIMPQIIDGREFGNVTGQLGSWTKIQFSSSNITQFLYLCIGASFAYVIYYYASIDRIMYNFILKCFTYSLVFVMIWGVFQYFCLMTGFPYPSSLFNNSAGKSVGEIDSSNVVTDEIQRISSVAIETSIMVQNFLIILPFLFFDALVKSEILKKRKEKILFLAIPLFIFLATSTSGMVSVGFMFLYLAIKFLQTKSLRQRIFYSFLVLILTAVACGIIFYLFHDIIVLMIFNKGDSYSAMERSEATLQAWHSFLSHPILGVGWGAVTSFDLFIRILSNAGLLGLFFFSLFIFQLIYNQNKKHLLNNTYKNGYYNMAVTSALIIVLFNNAISGFTFMFGHLWFIIGLAFVTYFKKDFKE